MIFQNCLKLRITVSKYHSCYLCQISLQIMLLPIQIFLLHFSAAAYNKKNKTLSYHWVFYLRRNIQTYSRFLCREELKLGKYNREQKRNIAPSKRVYILAWSRDHVIAVDIIKENENKVLSKSNIAENRFDWVCWIISSFLERFMNRRLNR